VVAEDAVVEDVAVEEEEVKSHHIKLLMICLFPKSDVTFDLFLYHRLTQCCA